MKLARLHLAVAAATMVLPLSLGALPAAAADAYWPVTINGSSSGQPFSEPGCLHITMPGLSRRVADFSLEGTIGNGFYGSLPGPVQFATNAGMLGSYTPPRDTTSFADSSGANGSVIVDAVPQSAQAYNSGNIFLAGTSSFLGMLGQIVNVASGDVRFTLTNRQVSGSMQLQGTGSLGYYQSYWYVASSSGTSTGARC